MNVKTMGAAVLVGMMVAGCGKDAASDAEKTEDVMAVSVNGEKLMQSVIDADVAKFIEQQGGSIPAEQLEYAKQNLANQLVSNFIFERVLEAKAKASGVEVTAEDRRQREVEFLEAMAKMPDAPKSLEEAFKRFPLGEARAREQFDRGLLIDKLIKVEQEKQPKRDFAAEAQKTIDGIVSNNVQAAAADAAALKKITELKAQLDDVKALELPAKFAELAKANSACPSSAKGGDLGEFTHGQMVKEFDEVAFTSQVNQVSAPVKTRFGYHLVMVTKKVPAVEAKDGEPAQPEKVQASHILVKGGEVREVPELETAVKYLENSARRAFMQEYVQEQIKAAKIEASEQYKRFLPAVEEPAAEPVEKPAEK